MTADILLAHRHLDFFTDGFHFRRKLYNISKLFSCIDRFGKDLIDQTFHIFQYGCDFLGFRSRYFGQLFDLFGNNRKSFTAFTGMSRLYRGIHCQKVGARCDLQNNPAHFRQTV